MPVHLSSIVRASPRGVAPAALFALCLVACGAGAFAAEEPPADDSSALHLRYAEARLKLARLDLDRALAADRQAGARVTSDTDARRLRARIRVLESQVEANRLHPHGNGIHGQRARARAAAEVAEEELDSIRAVHDRNPQAATDVDVARYEARAEIARLRVALWEDPSNVPSLIDEMQLQIDQLTDHVLDLLDEMENQRTITPGERR